MMRAGEEARYAGPRPTAGEELAVDRPTPQLEGSASWDDEGCVEGGGGVRDPSAAKCSPRVRALLQETHAIAKIHIHVPVHRFDQLSGASQPLTAQRPD
jgi:hypothetical protein